MITYKTRTPVIFDAEDENHLQHFFYFLKNNKWEKDAPLFELENNWIQIPEMICQKLALHFLTTRLLTK